MQKTKKQKDSTKILLKTLDIRYKVMLCLTKK